MVPVVSIVGKSNAGKTTLIEKLIPELKKRGHKIGVVKHAHSSFNIDKKGKDSFCHRAAGAHTVVVASPGRVTIMKDEEEDSLDSKIKYFNEVDLVICEGYKRANKLKIEIFRQEAHDKPLCKVKDNLIAMVTDEDLNIDVPVFGLEDVKNIVDFIEKTFLC